MQTRAIEHALTNALSHAPKPNQDTHRAQADPVQTQSRNICTHTQEHKHTCLVSVPTEKATLISLRCFFLVNTQNKAPLRVSQPQLQSQDTFVI